MPPASATRSRILDTGTSTGAGTGPVEPAGPTSPAASTGERFRLHSEVERDAPSGGGSGGPGGASVRSVRIPPRALDIGFAAVSAVLTTLVLLDSGIAAASDQSIAGERWWVAPVILIPSAALLFRRTHPLATIAGVWIPVAVQAQLTGDGGEGLYLVWPAWISLYALAAYGTRRQLLTGIPLALVCLAVHDLNDPLNWRTAEGAWAAAWWDLVLFVPALVGGIVAGSRRTRALAT